MKELLIQQLQMQTHRPLLRKERVKTLQVRDWRRVIQAIAGGLVKGINATFWAV
jgi:hypothetical protein